MVSQITDDAMVNGRITDDAMVNGREAEELLARIHHDDMTETLFNDISAALGTDEENLERTFGRLSTSDIWSQPYIEREKEMALHDMDQSLDIIRNLHNIGDYINEDYWGAIMKVKKSYTRFNNAPEAVRNDIQNEILNRIIEGDILRTLSNILEKQLFQGFDSYKETREFAHDLCRVCYMTLAFFFYFSDTSRKFAQVVTEESSSLLSSIKMILERFKVAHFVNDLIKELQEMLFVGLALSYNLVMHDDSQTILRIREKDLMGCVRPYLYSTEDRFKVLPLLFMLYVADESEYCSNPSVIRYLIDQLVKARKSPGKSAGGYKVMELMRAIEKLAALDINKQVLFEMGIIDTLQDIITDCDMVETKGCLHILTHLAFDKEIAKSLCRESRDFLQFINENFSDHENEDIKKAALSFDWVVRDKLGEHSDGSMRTRSIKRHAPVEGEEEIEVDGRDDDVSDSMVIVDSPSGMGHIMISYNWDNQPIARAIKEYLEKREFTVWYDEEQMGSNLLDSMAGAVENAWVVLLCYSRKYKLSRNCRLEAEYASNLQKPIIPVKMEPYEPDGWLGLLVGRLFIHDYTNEVTDEKNFQLFTALKRLEENLNKRESFSMARPSTSGLDTSSTLGLTGYTGDIPTLPSQNICSWTQSEVQEWFDENKISRSHFGDMTGMELKLLIRMHKDSSTYFYKYLIQIKKIPQPVLAAFIEALVKFRNVV